MAHTIIEMREEVLSSIRKKTGVSDIRLEPTRNGKARVVIGNGKTTKNFVTQIEALHWLIYTYNLKHLKCRLPHIHAHILLEPQEKNRFTIEDEAQTIIETILGLNHYSIDWLKTILNNFDMLKRRGEFTSGEVENIYRIVIDRLKRLCDETFNHQQYLVYKRYLDHIKARFGNL